MKDIFIYDLSCLISQQVYQTPSGTVRVDLRYAHYFLKNKRESTLFVRQYNNLLVIVDRDDAQALIEHLFEAWDIDTTEDRGNNFEQKNLEFRMLYHDLWDPDFETFFSMPYTDRFNYLLNQELTEILGSEFSWVRKLPYMLKICYAFIASFSKHLAFFLIRSAQFIGVYLHTKNLRHAFKFVFARRKRTLAITDIISQGDAEQSQHQYYYVYTAYNRGFPFKSLKQLADKIKLYYVVYIHDLIIINYPEYFLPVNRDEQIAWLKHLLRQKPLLITNSNTTKGHIINFAEKYKLELKPVITSYIGVEPHFLNGERADESRTNKPYFIFVSTIEPRKNHLLLLNIWRELALGDNTDTPELYIVGKRGWENENIVDMIERCRPLKGIVHELSDIKDSELISLLTGARALLYPSFCEGWGMPVAEALSLGTPTICSDIPELRESGQNIPDYISPIDGKKWKEIILDYSQENSKLRREQLRRIENYSPPTWQEHFETSMQAILGENAT